MLMKSKDSTNALSDHVPNPTVQKDLSINITNSNIQKYMLHFLMFKLLLVKEVLNQKVIKNNSPMILEIQTQNLTVFLRNSVTWEVLTTLKLMNLDSITLKIKKIKKINAKISHKDLIWAQKSNFSPSSKRKSHLSLTMEIKNWKEVQEQ